jgi:hypothetical protein
MQILIFRHGYALPQDPYQLLLLHFLRYRQLFPNDWNDLETSKAVELLELSAALEQLERTSFLSYRWSATAPMRLAKAAGEAMASDSGTMRALMTMSPQMATE